MAQKKIKLSHTRGEWSVVEDKIHQSNKTSIQSYLRAEIFKLKSKIIDCPDCVCYESGARIEKQIFIIESEYEILKKMSLTIGKPVATIIDEYFIIPLINQDISISNI